MLDFGIIPSTDDDFGIMPCSMDDIDFASLFDPTPTTPTATTASPATPTTAATTATVAATITATPTTAVTAVTAATTTTEPYCEPKVVKKKSNGKQKIKMAKIEMKNSRQVTFSKRRSGLLSKCGELCEAYDAQVAVITFSEAGNLFPYGHPNAEDVIQHYVDSCRTNMIGHNTSDHSLNCGVKAVEGSRASSSLSYWWDEVNVDQLDLSELEKFKATLENIKNEVVSSADGINRDSKSLVFNNHSTMSFDNKLECPMNEDVSKVDEINHGYSTSLSVPNNHCYRFDNLESSRNNEVVSMVDEINNSGCSTGLVPNNQGYRFDNLESVRNNEVNVPRVDQINRGYSTSLLPNNPGFSFDLNKYGGCSADGGLKFEGFQSINWMNNNNRAPPVYQPRFC